MANPLCLQSSHFLHNIYPTIWLVFAMLQIVKVQLAWHHFSITHFLPTNVLWLWAGDIACPIGVIMQITQGTDCCFFFFLPFRLKDICTGGQLCLASCKKAIHTQSLFFSWLSVRILDLPRLQKLGEQTGVLFNIFTWYFKKNLCCECVQSTDRGY